MSIWTRLCEPKASSPSVDPAAATVTQACELLCYAIESGKEIAPTIQEPLLQAEATIRGKVALSQAERVACLTAYGKLAALMTPVTANTLRASDRRYGHKGVMSRLLRIRPFADAQLHALAFGTLALLILVWIGATEWTRTFVTVITEMQANLTKVEDELRTTDLAIMASDRQQAATQALSKGPNSDVVREGLVKQRDELDARRDALTTRQKSLEEKIGAGYKGLNRWVPDILGVDLTNMLSPLGTMMGGFLLPILYGALGTCAYILRTIYSKMVERSYDPSRLPELVARIFLGTLSGVALQWLFVGDGKQIPGGVTPAVLAFLGGYSVELLFAAIDRVLSAAREAIRPTASTPAAPTLAWSRPP